MSGIVAQNVGRPSGLVKAVGGGGAWTEIKTLTASGDATLSFVDGTSDVVLDSTYPVYCFRFSSMHPETNDKSFTFQANAADGSGYNETMTTTHWIAYHPEDDAVTEFAYKTGNDQAEGTGFHIFGEGCGSDADQCISGYLYLFGPSSTTFVKHFFARASNARHNDSIADAFTAGYFNTTSAIDEIQFKFVSGDIDAGEISMFGIKGS